MRNIFLVTLTAFLFLSYGCKKEDGKLNNNKQNNQDTTAIQPHLPIKIIYPSPTNEVDPFCFDIVYQTDSVGKEHKIELFSDSGLTKLIRTITTDKTQVTIISSFNPNTPLYVRVSFENIAHTVAFRTRDLVWDFRGMWNLQIEKTSQDSNGNVVRKTFTEKANLGRDHNDNAYVEAYTFVAGGKYSPSLCGCGHIGYSGIKQFSSPYYFSKFILNHTDTTLYIYAEVEDGRIEATGTR